MSRLFNRQYLFQSGPEGLLTMKIRDAQKVLILIDAAQRVISNAPDRSIITRTQRPQRCFERSRERFVIDFSLWRSLDPRLRRLDIDDLLMMSMLYEGYELCEVAYFLGLSAPAVTQRARKIHDSTGIKLYVISNSNRAKLTEEGRFFCGLAKAAIEILSGAFSDSEKVILTYRPRIKGK